MYAYLLLIQTREDLGIIVTYDKWATLIINI